MSLTARRAVLSWIQCAEAEQTIPIPRIESLARPDARIFQPHDFHNNCVYCGTGRKA